MIRDWLGILSWRLRRVLRPICWWRGKHRGFWTHGRWICRTCAHNMFGPPPVGTFLTDEPERHIYQVGPHGELLRCDKVRGGKKARRRKRDQVLANKLRRALLLGDGLEKKGQGERR
jgi:hypothetical protein